MAGVCMRECAQCPLRQDGGCRGCLESGGEPVWGSCRVVACCHSRGQQNCGQCVNGPVCSKVQESARRREEWPQQEAQLRADWQAGMARRVPVLAKWLPVLFWVLVCSRVVNVLDQLGFTAGIGGVMTAVQLLMGLGILVVSLVMECLLYGAMAQELEQSAAPSPPGPFESVVQSLPQHLADNWRLLRKCVLGSLGAVVGSLILGILLSRLGSLGILFLLAALAAAVVLLGCVVAELVMLWKTSCFFRDALGDLPALPEGEP